jgi:hypothetical protein
LAGVVTAWWLLLQGPLRLRLLILDAGEQIVDLLLETRQMGF